MAQRGQRGLSYSKKRDLWAQWKQGQPMSEFARALEKNHGSIPVTWEHRTGEWGRGRMQ